MAKKPAVAEKATTPKIAPYFVTFDCQYNNNDQDYHPFEGIVLAVSPEEAKRIALGHAEIFSRNPRACMGCDEDYRCDGEHLRLDNDGFCADCRDDLTLAERAEKVKAIEAQDVAKTEEILQGYSRYDSVQMGAGTWYTGEGLEVTASIYADPVENHLFGQIYDRDGEVRFTPAERRQFVDLLVLLAVRRKEGS